MANNILKGLPFSDVLENLMDYTGDSRLISEKIAQDGYKVSIRSLQQYRSSECIPSVQTAKIILDALGEDFTLNDIKESLELEKEKQYDLKIDVSKIEKHLTLYENEFKDIANGEAGYVSDIIDQRIQELYPNQKRAFSLYVKDLIEADIIKNVVNK